MAFRPLITRSPAKINKVRPILLLTTCDICKLKYFKKNLIVCQNCPILICQKCIKHCGNCGRFLCEKCDDNYDCGVCKDRICSKCCDFCFICEEIYCEGVCVKNHNCVTDDVI